MSKVDFKSLKESKKAKSKALKGAIVLKKVCEITNKECTRDCGDNKCEKL